MPLEPDFVVIVDIDGLMMQCAAGIEHVEFRIGIALRTGGVIADMFGDHHDAFVALPAD